MGKKSTSDDSRLKVVPRKISVFVGRLDKATTADDISEFLIEAGAEVSSCKKLSNVTKSGREYQSAAFQVTCEAKYENIIYDENTWPLDSVIREWIYSGPSTTTTA